MASAEVPVLLLQKARRTTLVTSCMWCAVQAFFWTLGPSPWLLLWTYCTCGSIWMLLYWE